MVNQREAGATSDGSPCEIQALVLDPPEGPRLVLVSADLIWFPDDITAELRPLIAGLANTTEAAVSLSATHSHGTPQSDPRFRYGEASEPFRAALRDLTRRAVEQALASAPKPVALAQGHARVTGLAVHRRRMAPTLSLTPPWWRVQNLPNPSRAIPDRLDLLALMADDRPAALITCFCCHPVTDPPSLRGGDYPAEFRRELRARLKQPDLPLLMLQGFCGDVRPCLLHQPRGLKDRLLEAAIGPRFRAANAEDRIAFARRLADFAETALPDLAPLNAPSARAARQSLPLQDDQGGDCDRALDLTAWHLAPGFGFLFASGEMLSGLDDHAADGLISVGYANGMVGYVAPDEEVRGGGYEIDGFLPRFDLKRRFHPGTGNAVRAARRLLAKG